MSKLIQSVEYCKPAVIFLRAGSFKADGYTSRDFHFYFPSKKGVNAQGKKLIM